MNLDKAATLFWNLSLASRRAPTKDTPRQLDWLVENTHHPSLVPRVRELREQVVQAA